MSDSISFEERKEQIKQKQKEYRRQVYQAMKAKKAELTKKERAQKKLNKAQEKEEALRKKNAQLWDALRFGSSLSDEETETESIPPCPNPFR